MKKGNSRATNNSTSNSVAAPVFGKGTCHNRGAGCIVGSSCPAPPGPKPGPSNDTCSAYTSCKTCTNYSSLCHWCGSSCNVLGSPYGCAVGVSCMANTGCIRKHPKFIEVQSAPGFVYIISMGVFVLVCGLAGCLQCEFLTDFGPYSTRALLTSRNQVDIKDSKLNYVD